MKKLLSLLGILLLLVAIVPAGTSFADDDNDDYSYKNAYRSDDSASNEVSKKRSPIRGKAVKKHRREMAGQPVTEDCLVCHEDWTVTEPPAEEPPVVEPPVVEPPVIVDADQDGVADDVDSCPNTPVNELVNANGCSDSQLDSDMDGVSDAYDLCPNTAIGIEVDVDGCDVVPADSDNDGVVDAQDACTNTPSGEAVDASGCGASQLDSDNDGVSNDQDQCPGTAAGVQVDAVGCEVTTSILKAPAETLCASCHSYKNPANYAHTTLQSIHGYNCTYCHNF